MMEQDEKENYELEHNHEKVLGRKVLDQAR